MKAQPINIRPSIQVQHRTRSTLFPFAHIASAVRRLAALEKRIAITPISEKPFSPSGRFRKTV